MAGIYIHIPFCKKACHYCNFHFSTSLQSLPEMVNAICREALLQSAYLTEPVSTIYLGGGTPSLISSLQLLELMQCIRANYPVLSDAEISIEANPDDVTEKLLTGWKEAGINRISLGIQSFFEDDLQWMNRAHDAIQAKNSLQLVREMGFTNITIDLIYGSPGLTDEKWEQNLATAISLQIPHISCYALTVEPKTALAAMISKGQKKDVDPDKQASQFSILTKSMKKAGFDHYEISNFAMPGFRSRHNSSYWQGKPYLGLGPSAHSFNGISRQWNIANNASYLSGIGKGHPIFEIEVLTPTQQLNEYIMTSLRTQEGISLQKVANYWGENMKEKLCDATQKHKERGHLLIDEKVIRLSEKGMFLADGIASDLFD